MKGLYCAIAAALLLMEPALAQPGSAGPDQAIVPLMRFAPQYPRSAQRDGIEGYVEFAVVVHPDGTVKEARVLKSEPEGVFEAAAELAMRRWKFKPRIVDGKAVEASGIQRIEFRLETFDVAACEAGRRPERRSGSVGANYYKKLEAVMDHARKPDYAAAEQALAAVLEQAANPYESAVAFQTQAFVQAMLKKPDEAIASYERALATNALSWSLHDQVTVNIAKLHVDQRRNELASQILDRYFRESCAPSRQARELQARLNVTAPAEAPKP